MPSVPGAARNVRDALLRLEIDDRHRARADVGDVTFEARSTSETVLSDLLRTSGVPGFSVGDEGAGEEEGRRDSCKRLYRYFLKRATIGGEW